MNEDINEKNGDFFEENKEFKEDIDNEFEPMDEASENNNDLDIFEPKDEQYEVHESFNDEFEPRENNNRRNNSVKVFNNRISEKNEEMTLQKLYNDGVRKNAEDVMKSNHLMISKSI